MDIETPGSPLAIGNLLGTPNIVENAKRFKANRKFRFVLAIIVVCGFVCVSVGAALIFHHRTENNAASIITALQKSNAIKLTLLFKRKSLLYYGQSQASIYIIPRESTNKVFEFDATMTLTDGTAVEKYAFVDNHAYVSSSVNGTLVDTRCLHPSQIPPFELMQSSLSSSKVIDAADFGSEVSINVENSCPDGNLLHLSFAGESFVFCKSANHQLTNGYGQDMDLKIEYIESVPFIEKPQPLDGQVFTCQAIPFTKTTEQSSRSITSWSDYSNEVLNILRGVPRVAELGESSCGCKTEKKPCLFVHGLGHFNNRSYVTDTHSKTWGNIQEYAPCCTITKFMHLDTIQKGWTDPDIHRDFCNVALNISGSVNNTIGKLILVAHSMGNLIISGSIANGVCNMSSDVTWISAAAPMLGSKASNLLDMECSNPSARWIEVLSIPLKRLGLCPVTPAFRSLFYYPSTTDPRKKDMFDAAVQVRATYATKIICGLDSWGINTFNSPVLKSVGDRSLHDGAHDGVVSQESCQAGFEPAMFSSEPSNSYYTARINHFDASFRYGDGWWGIDRKPLKWFQCAL